MPDPLRKTGEPGGMTVPAMASCSSRKDGTSATRCMRWSKPGTQRRTIMGKHKKGKHHKEPALNGAEEPALNGAEHNGDGPVVVEAPALMSRQVFEKKMGKLQYELVKLQEWVKYTNAKICIVFEGRDAAGKGGIIKRLTERTSPRVLRVVALPSPTEREKSQMYLQRYIQHLPAGGEITLLDRSWYNRAGVERVMGFATDEQVRTFLDNVPYVENAIINSGVILVKYWLEVSEENQTE